MRRSKRLPWWTAGRVSDGFEDNDAYVGANGWMFNRGVPTGLSTAEFVATGDQEVPPYLTIFDLRGDGPSDQTIVEIGAGIGRMTCAFTREFGSVVACDLDAGFLERCYQVVSRYGRVERLRTSHVADGHSLDLPDNTADVTFSYITLQHCDEQDALDLCQEAVRVTKPGGKVALNFRARSMPDLIILPLGGVVRSLYRVPAAGRAISNSRSMTRLAWQASRLHPDQVTAQLGNALTDTAVWTNSSMKMSSADAVVTNFDGINPHHWWLVATVG